MMLANLRIMERRAFKRKDSSLPVKYFCDKTLYSGTIRNLSEKGMFITTCDFLPCDDTLELLVPLNEEISKFIAKIRRIVKIDDNNYHIGVELLHPPKNYIDYVNSLNAV